MSETLKEILKNFSAEVEATLIATGIVSIDGKLEVYDAHSVRGGTYNVERSASIFAMIVNILDKTLIEVYEGKEDVAEVLVTTKKSFYIFRAIGNGAHFQGATFTIDTDVNQVREIMKKYEPLFVEAL